ncbi:response regulator [Pseudobacteriovorax antillogorgiicola]|uniref:Response regulator receiver domain-containing protein n=1 Tax=Pseudobacteriovorax antillogorgiicola TaxID=1513793 RepID=A0A1Y6BC32_9BACT|nr:response regulator [Pseudobacteriovorax antillogorgiicola]TCS58698.1 response regulator receiver domain-containing protein [Pseudobacteriovorax antillogorgiicola]SME95717.1 Response regulator receiver domain-containing protein [Pseudobacteriovorax antillogorgiicola]
MEASVELKTSKQNRKILVLDDDESFCKLVQAIAGKQDVQLEYITHADEIENVPDLEYFDAIWIDYDLLETTGLAVAEELNENHPTVPVVMISSSNRVFTDDMKELKNIKGILSKWELSDEEIRHDILESSLGHFHSSEDVHSKDWVNNDDEQLEHLRDHFQQEVPHEKYRA